MTTVYNTLTFEESVYSITPENAVISAHESSKGNGSTWKYPKPENHPLYKKTRKGHSCGNFWAKHQ